MATVATTSKKFSLKLTDWEKGLIVAAISPIVPIIMQSLNAGSFTLDWKVIGTTALAAGIAYLAKNFFSPAQTVITGIPVGTTTTVTIPPPGVSVPALPIVTSDPPEPKKAA